VAVGTARLATTRSADLALSDPRRTFTWSELDEVLNRLVNRLISLGLAPGQRVAVYAENAAETVLSHVAGTLAGLSTVPISFHLTVEEVTYILEDSGTAVLFVGPETAEHGVQAAAAAGCSCVIGWRSEHDAIMSWQAWLDASSASEPPADLVPKPHLHYTSGTTGRPKGTETPPSMFAGGSDMEDYVVNLASNIMITPGSTALVVSPLHHTGPLSIIRGLVAGVGLVVLQRFDAERTLAAIDEFKINTVMMVPTHFQRLLALPRTVRDRYDVSSIQLIAHTGAACPVDVKRQMIDWFGPVLFEAYGATEAGTTNAITSQEWLDHPGSVGRCAAPYEVVVVDNDGKRVGPNQVGNLYFRDLSGRGIIYHNDPEKTADAHLEQGVFTLGEVGYVDHEGYVFITDRQSDMVVSGGVNIYPAEAEQVLIEHPGVRDVACVGVPDADLGEQLKALVVPFEPARPPSAQELIEFCRRKMARYKAPRSVEIVTDIGRNSMGKINKRALRAPYWPADRTIGG
jgi:acyl-CoA synthetase (AMP-forming)/AMP-acid ligase II